MRGYLQGLEVHILSEQTMKQRAVELESEGLALDGQGHATEGEATTSKGLVNCKLIQVFGFTTDERAIRSPPLAKADAAVVVADANEEEGEALGGAELQIADSEALTTTIILRRLRSEVERENTSVPPLTIVTEFVDLLTRRLLERQSDLITVAPNRLQAPEAARGLGWRGLPAQGSASWMMAHRAPLQALHQPHGRP